MRVCELQGV